MRCRRPLIATLVLAVLAWGGGAHATARHAAMVIDANSGRVLHAKAADEPRYPASLTKMMTLYMAFELIDAGRLSYNSRIKISQEAASVAPSKLDLEPGESIVLIDAIKALVTKSANDIAVAVAEHIGGSEANFARLMTNKARQIGMKNTVFRNASGLPDPEQTTTARDMLTLALRLQDDFPKHYKLFATRTFSYAGMQHRNHNTLLGSFAGTEGIKTGYTRASGFNLVASVRRNGRHVVAVVFGGASAASRNAQMRALLTRAIATASTKKTRKPVLVARPKPAARPSRAVAAAEPKPEPRREPRAATTPAPAPIVQVSSAPQPAPAAESAAAVAEAPRVNIEIARVRRVMVAPRVRPERRVAQSTEEPSPASIQPHSAPLQEARATAPASAASADAPLTDAEPPPSRRLAYGAAMPRAAINGTGAPPMASQAVAAQPIAVASAAGSAVGLAVTPGRPPSTLQQQAMALAAVPAGAPANIPPSAHQQPTYRLQGPPQVPAAPATGRFQIQVGAYATAIEAERQLTAVRSRAGRLLETRQTLAIPVTKGNRQLYRARFAGFDANGAANTCTELRRLGVDCFVMRAE